MGVFFLIRLCVDHTAVDNLSGSVKSMSVAFFDCPHNCQFFASKFSELLVSEAFHFLSNSVSLDQHFPTSQDFFGPISAFKDN